MNLKCIMNFVLCFILLTLPCIPVIAQQQTLTPSPSPGPATTVRRTCLTCLFTANGYVRNTVTNNGVPAAQIVVTASMGTTSTTTDSTGYYNVRISACSFADIVTFTITAPGYTQLVTARTMASGCLTNTYDFTLTPDGTPVGGAVWFVPGAKTHVMIDLTFFDQGIPPMPTLINSLILGSYTFTNEIHVDSGNQLLSAFDFDISFDNAVVAINTSAGVSGVSAGADGFVTQVDTATAGLLSVTGLDTDGKGPGSDLHALTIHWLAQTYSGTTPLHLTINSLEDNSGNTIGNPAAGDGSITIRTITCKIGDANADGIISIVDALLIAQYAVGLSVSVNVTCGDVNCDGRINIIDALMIAQYYVGLLSTFPC